MLGSSCLSHELLPIQKYGKNATRRALFVIRLGEHLAPEWGWLWGVRNGENSCIWLQNW